MAEEITDEALAERFRASRAQMIADRRELERRGFAVELGRKTARITRTETKVQEL